MPYHGLGANLEVATFPGCLPIWRRLLGEIRAPYRGKPVLRTESERLLSSMGANISPRTSLINIVPTPHNYFQILQQVCTQVVLRGGMSRVVALGGVLRWSFRWFDSNHQSINRRHHPPPCQLSSAELGRQAVPDTSRDKNFYIILHPNCFPACPGPLGGDLGRSGY